MTTPTSYDLSPKYFKYLTPHLIAQLLSVLQQQKEKAYPEDFLLKQRFKVLAQTTNYAQLLELIATYPTIVPQDQKAEFTTLKAEFAGKLSELQTALGAELSQYLIEVEAMPLRDLQSLKRDTIKCTITLPQLSTLQQYAALSVSCGNYLTGAISYLIYYLQTEGLIAGPHAVTKDGLWKMVEASLLCKQHHLALYEVFMKKLRDLIDTQSTNLTLSQQTTQRVTYLVWTLYAFTTNPQSNALLSQRSIWSDMIYCQQIMSQQSNQQQHTPNMSQSNERLLNALVFEVPSLLRYVVLCTLIAARVPSSPTTPWLLKRSPFFKEMSRVLQIQFSSTNADSTTQPDPVIKFFQQLLIEFDIPNAIITLNNDIPKVFATDPFLSNQALQLEFYDATKAILIDTVLKLNTNLTLPALQAMIPLSIQCEGFDNTISLTSTAAPVKGDVKDAADKKAAETAAAAATATTATTPETEQQQPQQPQQPQPEEEVAPAVITPTATAVYTSPLLSKGDFHTTLMKKVRPQQKYQQNQQQQQKA